MSLDFGLQSAKPARSVKDAPQSSTPRPHRLRGLENAKTNFSLIE